MLLFLYRWLTLFASPMITLYLIYRSRRGKEDDVRLPERQGYASLPRPSGSLVWIHAASIGEAVSVLPLLRLILDGNPALHALMTTGTVTSSELLASKLPPRTLHQFIPVDTLWPVQRFLEHWKPDLALFVESELWPNLIGETARRSCPIILLNARMSDRSLKKWQRFSSLARQMLSCFTLVLAQSAEDRERLEMLGAQNVRYLGNLKFDAPPLPADPKETGKLLSRIGKRPLWLAASTHEGEEALAADVHHTLKNTYKNALTIIVPRHPERGRIIAEICRQKGLNVMLRTKGETIQDATDIYIADTIGELGLFYRLSSIAFLGGSLVPHGGQNPLEAARLECAIIAGPHTHNFTRIYEELIQTSAALRIHSKSELETILQRLFSEPSHQRELAAKALKLVESKTGVAKAFLKSIEPYLPRYAKNT